MEILCHRGWWDSPSEQNSLASFEKAFAAGLGVELDIRDFDSLVAISHDPIKANHPLVTLEDVLNLREKYSLLPIAINVKADGLVPMIEELRKRLNFSNTFFFDMSVPESLRYKRAGLPCAGRLSEFEKDAQAGGSYWLDAFETDWWMETSDSFFSGTSCFLVSPELHGREHQRAWERAKVSPFIKGICTDYFSEAMRYFHGI